MGKKAYSGAMTPTLNNYLKDYNDSRMLHNQLQFKRDGKPNTLPTHAAMEQIATALRTEAATNHTAALLQSLQNKYKVNTKSPEMMRLLDLLYKEGSNPTVGVKGKSTGRDITTLVNEFATAFNIPPGKEMDKLRKMLIEYKAMIKTQKEIADAMKDTKQVSVRGGKIIMYDQKSSSPYFTRWLRRLIRRPKVEIPKF